MAELRKFRRLSLLPLIAWLLMQVATASVFVPPADAALRADALAEAGALSGNSIVICTPRGLVVINLDANGKEAPENPEVFPGCEWCQPFGGSAAMAGPEQPGLRLPDTTLYRVKATQARIAAAHGDAEAFRSRAPPL
ncbi:hypothetical protein [Denitrobaculum tricleocarpae]|uniref:DUF2946 domain-containing protein n=1 Tax=Denitrobaculum tricleocarpae TaxID=2591009 RepID=A0A545TKR3_9PROT|nr:hypothetical protein [Denitrobaculum tricleocarpae]TQV77815.1 hypothetical protein FKG95_19855 [Denitrobaculum tricleocarpae]